MNKMNNQYSLSTVNQVQNSKKRKKILTNKEINKQNPVKLIKPTITNINSINNNFTNSNLNFLKNKNNYDEEFEIIEPSLQNTLKKSKETIQISNNIHLSNRNLNSLITGFTSTADSKSLNVYQNVNDGSLYVKDNKKTIIKKPKKIYGLSARELLDIVDRRKKILGLRTNYSNNSMNDYKDKSGEIKTSLFYDHNYFNDVSNSIDDNNFINMSFSQINTLKLSNIKNKSIKRKCPIKYSKDIVNCIFDDENEKDIYIENINNNNIIENNNFIENNSFEVEKKDEKINNINSKIEESIFNIEKNSDDEEELKFNEFKIESNNETSFDKNSKDKSVILNKSISSPVKLSFSSSSSSLNKEEVTQFDEFIQTKVQNETKDIIDINFILFKNNKKDIKKEDTNTKQKINFFEETRKKISKKICKEQNNDNLLKLLPPSPNFSGNKNIIKFIKNKYCNEINKEDKYVRQMKSFDINKDRNIDFKPSDYCILKTSSLEKKSNRSYSKRSRNKKIRQVGNYSDYYKNKINEIFDIKRLNKRKKIITNNNKKHIILKVNSKK